MAVDLLAIPSASAQIHEGGDGEMELIGIHEDVGAGIQYKSSFDLGSDFIPNGEDFQREIDRILKTILLKISPFSDLLKCPDGGHRCPYFPCPTCHRTRSISGPKSSHNVHSRSSNLKLSGIWHHALTRECEEDEVISQENPSANSNAYIDMHPLSRAINCDQIEFFVPVRECGDDGHRCPYFPCPYCHRSRSIFTCTEN